MKDRHVQIRERLDAIIAEMKKIGFWALPQPSQEDFENMGAFGLNTMAFAQWLRYVFVPNVESRLADGGPWPSTSMVGAQAIREFDGQDNAQELVGLLIEFDQLF